VQEEEIAAIQRMLVNMDPDAALTDQIFEVSDHNHDGKISREGFERALREGLIKAAQLQVAEEHMQEEEQNEVDAGTEKS
jgi:Ca2+-binding EF-hand superfamily protein